MNYDLTLADVLAWAAAYDGPLFHALLADAPYHLTEITDRFGKANAAPAQFGSDGAFQRASKGFMGQTWDGGDIAFRPETWATIAQHLYPGAFGMAFAGSRGWHRMAVAIEDAGLIIHPTVFCWSYGSGFPKATSPAQQYVAEKLRAWLLDHPDAAAELKAAREAVRSAKHGETAEPRKAYQVLKQRLCEAASLTREVSRRKHAPKFDAAGHGYREKDNGFNSTDLEDFAVVEHLDPIAAALAGHRYGLQAMKPAVEPIVVFQKPYDGRAIDGIVATGAGCLNIDGARIPSGDDHREKCESVVGLSGNRNGAVYGEWAGERESSYSPAGRWPANLVLVHHPACDDGCHPDCAVLRLGAQGGTSTTGNRSQASRNASVDATQWLTSNHRSTEYAGDTGTAARYFHNADWMYERLELADHVGYFAKASRAEREAGLDPEQIALMRLIDDSLDEFDLTTVDDGREVSIDNPYQRGETERRNTHPTIKPISLTRWLATLLLPPALGQERRLLVPFAGTGSEMAGAILAGWEYVQGVELGADHVRIGRARLAYWAQRAGEFSGGRPIKVKAPKRKKKGATTEQHKLFEDAA